MESLRKLTKEDIYQWFVSHFKGGKNYKKLSVQVRFCAVYLKIVSCVGVIIV